MAIAIALAQLLVGLFAGVMVDRWSRRRVMIVSDLVRAGLVLGFLAVTSGERLWFLYLIAFTQSAVGTFFNPARATLLAELLPAQRLVAANSSFDTSRVVAGVGGVALAGLLASVDSIAAVFLIDAATFAMSAALVARVAAPAARHRRAPSRFARDLGDGLVLIRRSRMVVGVITVGSVAMFGLGAVNVLLVPFVVGDLGASEAWFGGLEAAMVAAMVGSGAVVAAAAQRINPMRLISAGAVGLGAGVAGLALTQAAWQLLPLMFAAGACVTPLQAAVTTLLQTKVPHELRARTQAAFATLIAGANLASMSLVGAAAAVAGVRGVLVAAGFVVVSAGVAARPLLRGPAASAQPVLEVR
jgi:MFS family permease